MIRVTIDMWPGGDERKARRLASVNITNTARGTEHRGEYHVQAFDKNDRAIAGRVAAIGNWPRLSKPVLSLVRTALEFMRY